MISEHAAKPAQTTAHQVGRRDPLAVLRHLAIALSLSYLLALSAQLRAPVPFSPVPVTGQTLVVLLIGALLPRPYLWSTFGVYLFAGNLGLPYFAGSTLSGPTGGYLVGFVACALVVNALLEKGWGRHPFGVLLTLTIGNVLIYALGLPWLAVFVGLERVLLLGFLPFVVGDLLKLVCAAGMVAARNRVQTGRGVVWEK